MATVVGIDEAGLGPVLGPMVTTATVFDVPEALAGVSLWKLLASAVSRRPPKRASRLAIADSKTLYRGLRQSTLEHIERGVLAALASMGGRPATLLDLLHRCAPGAGVLMQRYDWYAGADIPLPHVIASADHALERGLLGAAMRRHGIRLADIRCEVLFAGEFNDQLAATDNKAAVAFGATARLLARAGVAPYAPGSCTCIHVDRQGGRKRYSTRLAQLFPGATVTCGAETDRLSAYRVRRAGRAVGYPRYRAGDRRRWQRGQYWLRRPEMLMRLIGPPHRGHGSSVPRCGSR